MSEQGADVVALLEQQHARIRNLFTALDTAGGDDRERLFRELVRLLAVHETAEEEIVHPAARGADGGHAVVEARIEEERQAKELLSTMDQLGAQDARFDTLLAQLRLEVLTHAEQEEKEEFPRLRAVYDERQLRALAVAVRAAEAVAPTRPHPGVESAAANLLLGPPTALVDRARDAIRAALKR